MQRILVTGGLGFIGSNFIHHLLDTEPALEIVNLDKLTYAGNPQNLADRAADPRYRLVKGDIADRALVEGLLRETPVDAIVHFAAESFVDRAIADASPFVRTNVLGTQVLLDCALACGRPRFLHVSTDEVYGSLGDAGEFTEDSPLRPNNPYAASKAGADLLCRSYHVTHGLPVVVTRCSNNYGPRQFPEKVIPLFIQRALRGEPLPVYGDGLHVRDWLYVEDHCRALWLIAREGRPGEVYNIGGGTELANLDLTRLLLGALNKPESLIRFVPDRPGHDRRYAISHGKLRGELGWDPQVSFADGLRLTIQWYLDHPKWLRAIADGTYQEEYV